MGKNPIPQGKYVPAKRKGDLIFTAGMTPRKDGVLLAAGKVKAGVPLSTYKEAVELAAANALAAARNQILEGESLTDILTITVFVNAEEGFTDFSALADIASAYYCAELGEAGVGTRAAVGVACLPKNAPVEISIVAACGKAIA